MEGSENAPLSGVRVHDGLPKRVVRVYVVVMARMGRACGR